MTVKDMLCGLARAGGQALHSLSTAATEVLRHADFQQPEETDLERYTRETRDFYTKSPNGDGRYDLDPNGVRDSL